MKKITIALVVVAVVAVFGWLYMDNIERAKFATSLFNGERQYHKFSRVAEFMPVTTMTASAKPFQFANGEDFSLPENFSFNGESVNSEAFLTETDTSALLVIVDGAVRFERYSLSGGRKVNWLSMSVAKSVIATAIGIAVDEQKIDIHKTMTDYVPSLKGSAYDGAKIKDVLQMSSGAAWSEDYSDPESDVMRLGKVMALGGSMDEFVQGMSREWEPGTANRYNSGDTQALGMLLTAATGTTITQYIQDKIWHPLGMESDAYWMVDDHNMEMAFGGLNATARDYAKIGELYRHNGLWQGKRIVSADWIEKATKPDAPYLMPGVHEDFPLGYGYQWWVPESTEGEYMAIGVYNQFIYINPSRNLVIVKLSANPTYGTTNDEESNQEMETIEFLRAIGHSLTK